MSERCEKCGDSFCCDEHFRPAVAPLCPLRHVTPREERLLAAARRAFLLIAELRDDAEHWQRIGGDSCEACSDLTPVYGGLCTYHELEQALALTEEP